MESCPFCKTAIYPCATVCTGCGARYGYKTNHAQSRFYLSIVFGPLYVIGMVLVVLYTYSNSISPISIPILYRLPFMLGVVIAPVGSIWFIYLFWQIKVTGKQWWRVQFYN